MNLTGVPNYTKVVEGALVILCSKWLKVENMTAERRKTKKDRRETKKVALKAPKPTGFIVSNDVAGLLFSATPI